MSSGEKRDHNTKYSHSPLQRLNGPSRPLLQVDEPALEDSYLSGRRGLKPLQRLHKSLVDAMDEIT